MAIVHRPDGNRVTLYDIPDSELEQYKIPSDQLAEMFPQKQDLSPDDAHAVAKAAAPGGDDPNPYVCYSWQCDPNGNCSYVWWFCPEPVAGVDM